MLSMPSALPQPALHSEEGARMKQLQAQLSARGPTAAGKPQDTQAAATELGALFVLQVLQAMRRTVPKGGLLEKGFAHETYLSMFDQEIARHIAQREDLGLQALLQRQLKTPVAGSSTPDQAATAKLPESDARSTAVNGLTRGAAMAAYRQQGGPAETLFRLPVDGALTSAFGLRTHPIHQDERVHQGVDFAAPAGTPIQAAAAGQVVFSGAQSGYGNVVILQHPNGYTTRYAHNAENLVAVGSTVRQGQPIATVGQTGDATGPHLHFEIRQENQPLDPMPLLAAEGKHKKPVKFLMASTDTEAIQ